MNEVINSKLQGESTTDNHKKNSQRHFRGLFPFNHSLRIIQKRQFTYRNIEEIPLQIGWDQIINMFVSDQNS